jgi:hypothetical protein
MASKHVFKPTHARREYGRIGYPPLSSMTGLPLQQQLQYMLQYNQRGNVFTFSGPPDNSMNCDYDGSPAGTFYVPLRGPQKYDSSDTTRQLHGAFLPWAMSDTFSVYYTDTQHIQWKDGTGGSFASIWEKYLDYPYDKTLVDYGFRSQMRQPFLLPEGEYYDNFVWTPPADGEWYLCSAQFDFIMPAAFSIWDGPDITVDDDQIRIAAADVAPGQLIRGYNADGDNHQSLGHIQRWVGRDDMTEDSLCNMTSRALLATGHPIGIWTDSATYVNIGGTDCDYKVRPRQVEGLSSGTVTSLPAIVVTTTGCDADNKAYVKYTAERSTDTWEVEISSNLTASMIENTGGTTSDLDLNYDYDYIAVELKATGTSEITLHTFVLWEDYYLA